MSKLTKAKAKLHQQACDLIVSDRTLTYDERMFVLEHWQESAKHVNSVAGAFFTPLGLASDFDLHVSGRRIIDLCAGIGTLSFMAMRTGFYNEPVPEVVCIEINPDYVAVGRRIVPDATWICGSVFDLPPDLGRFDCAISNPPFGAVQRNGKTGPRFTGPEFEYHVIDIAGTIADEGAFIIPQMSAPFRYSGEPCFREEIDARYRRFTEQTGITLRNNIGIDTTFYQDDWHGVSPRVEIAVADFRERADQEAQAPASLRDAEMATPTLFDLIEASEAA